MMGLTLPLWPIHFKPLPDELLSSWLVRLAHAHGLKTQTFCTLIFSSKMQIFNRDIDRLAPDWLLNELSNRTETSHQEVFKTTLRSYMGWIFPQMRTSSTLRWITSLKLHHRKFKGFGIQFCPKCLKDDTEPYFRKKWRVAFNTICPKHNCMLRDRCPSCGSEIAFHRIDTGLKSFTVNVCLKTCHQCGFDLTQSPAQEIIFYCNEIHDWLYRQSIRLTEINKGDCHEDREQFMVMRQLAMLLTSRYKSVKLHEFVCSQLNISETLFSGDRVEIETQSIYDRHHLIQLIGWLMIDIENRLGLAWRNKSIRYSHLIKDFQNAPDWYLSIANKFTRWRDSPIT